MADQSSVTPSTDPTESKPVLLKMSEVYRQTGVDVDALKMLIEDDLLVHGVERGRGGHVYVKADSLPTYDALLALLREQLVRELRSGLLHVQVTAVSHAA